MRPAVLRGNVIPVRELHRTIVASFAIISRVKSYTSAKQIVLRENVLFSPKPFSYESRSRAWHRFRLRRSVGIEKKRKKSDVLHRLAGRTLKRLIRRDENRDRSAHRSSCGVRDNKRPGHHRVRVRKTHLIAIDHCPTVRKRYTTTWLPQVRCSVIARLYSSTGTKCVLRTVAGDLGFA